VTGVILDVFPAESDRTKAAGTFNVLTYTQQLISENILANSQADLERFKIGAGVQIRYLGQGGPALPGSELLGEDAVLEIYILT
jgi:hypothetical protein